MTNPLDKLLVAAVLERGKRRGIDDDRVAPKDEAEEAALGTPGLEGVAAELGVDVSVDEADQQPWEEPPAKLDQGGGGRAHPGGARRHRRRHDRHR